MRNEWTTIRLQHKVSGAMIDRKIGMTIPILKEEGGKVVKSTDKRWINISVCSPAA